MENLRPASELQSEVAEALSANEAHLKRQEEQRRRWESEAPQREIAAQKARDEARNVLRRNYRTSILEHVTQEINQRQSEIVRWEEPRIFSEKPAERPPQKVQYEIYKTYDGWYEWGELRNTEEVVDLNSGILNAFKDLRQAGYQADLSITYSKRSKITEQYWDFDNNTGFYDKPWKHMGVEYKIDVSW